MSVFKDRLQVFFLGLMLGLLLGGGFFLLKFDEYIRTLASGEKSSKKETSKKDQKSLPVPESKSGLKEKKGKKRLRLSFF